MKFSVVIVNYASWPLTAGCVASLFATNYEDFEVIVVDNDGLDASEPPKLPNVVRLIQNRENAGFGRACNQGIAAATGEYVVLINPDTVVEESFFERMRAFFEEHTGVGIVGPRILDAGGGLQLSARREISIVSGLLGRTSLLTRLFPKSTFVKGQFPAVSELDHPTAVDWVSGACMVARREVLTNLGGFDERFFMYFEDADLCRRMRGAGWFVYYLPGVEVVHQTGGSSRSRPKAIWLLHKSAFLYHRKHGAHGPLNAFSVLVVLGLAGRALAKLVASSLRGLSGR